MIFLHSRMHVLCFFAAFLLFPTLSEGCQGVLLSSGACLCTDPGYTGALCDENVNECGTNNGNCAHNCFDTIGSYYCNCTEGYQLESNEHSCADIDECAEIPEPCAADATCQNVVGSYHCHCASGYTYDYEANMCSDIDECATNNGNCDQICSNNNGSYACECNEGYILNQLTKTCSNVDECATNTDNCDQLCFDTIGSYYCNCTEGYTLDINGYSCTDIDECATNNGNCDQICTNYNGSYVCECNEGYMMNQTTEMCSNVNECATNTDNYCDQLCFDTVGSYYCNCTEGYMLEWGRICTDINECEEFPAVCPNMTMCLNTPGSYMCRCPSGYTYDYATDMCSDIDECMQTPGLCKNGSICENWNGTYSCRCPSGLNYDYSISMCTNTADCMQTPGLCRNGAVCESWNGSNICTCPLGFYYDYSLSICANEDECLMRTANCPPGTTCEDLLGSYVCNCPPGYSLDLTTMMCSLVPQSAVVHVYDMTISLEFAESSDPVCASMDTNFGLYEHLEASLCQSIANITYPAAITQCLIKRCEDTVEVAANLEIEPLYSATLRHLALGSPIEVSLLEAQTRRAAAANNLTLISFNQITIAVATPLDTSGVSLVCGVNSMIIKVNRAIADASLFGANMTLLDPGCVFDIDSQDPNFYSYRVDYLTCRTLFRDGNDSLIYTQHVMRNDAEIIYSPYYYHYPNSYYRYYQGVFSTGVLFTVNCTVDVSDGDVILKNAILADNSVDVISGSVEFDVEMLLYESGTYTTVVEESYFPQVVEDQMLSLRVRMETDNPNLVLLVPECIISSSPHWPNTMVYLIDEGCPYIDEVKIVSRDRLKLDFAAPALILTDGMMNGEAVYYYCYYMVCDSADLSQNCSYGLNLLPSDCDYDMRSKRSLPEYKKKEAISNGIVVMVVPQTEEEKALHSDSFEYMLFGMLVAGTAVCTFILTSVFCFFLMKRRK